MKNYENLIILAISILLTFQVSAAEATSPDADQAAEQKAMEVTSRIYNFANRETTRTNEDLDVIHSKLENIVNRDRAGQEAANRRYQKEPVDVFLLGYLYFMLDVNLAAKTDMVEALDQTIRFDVTQTDLSPRERGVLVRRAFENIFPTHIMNSRFKLSDLERLVGVISNNQNRTIEPQVPFAEILKTTNRREIQNDTRFTLLMQANRLAPTKEAFLNILALRIRHYANSNSGYRNVYDIDEGINKFFPELDSMLGHGREELGLIVMRKIVEDINRNQLDPALGDGHSLLYKIYEEFAYDRTGNLKGGRSTMSKDAKSRFVFLMKKAKGWPEDAPPEKNPTLLQRAIFDADRDTRIGEAPTILETVAAKARDWRNFAKEIPYSLRSRKNQVSDQAGSVRTCNSLF